MLKYFLEKDSLSHSVLRISIAILLLSSNLAGIYGGGLEILTLRTYLFVLKDCEGWRFLFMLIAWPTFGFLVVIWPFVMGLSLLLKVNLFSLLWNAFK